MSLVTLDTGSLQGQMKRGSRRRWGPGVLRSLETGGLDPSREELGRGSLRRLGSPLAGPRRAGNGFRPCGFRHTHFETTDPKPPFRGLPLPASGPHLNLVNVRPRNRPFLILSFPIMRR